MSVGPGAAIGGGGLLVVLVASLLLGQNPLQILELITTTQGGGREIVETPASGPPQDTLGRFASVVLADTEETWKQMFNQSGREYQEPRLVLFSGAVQSACGLGSAAVGPFYCPLDRKIYLDLSFFRELDRRFGAPGEFGAAYVIAHEVGHHVQHQLGRMDPGGAKSNSASVRLELQADCLAGVWGFHAKHGRQMIEEGDFEAGLNAAAAIGDDRLQRMGQGHVQPESWTHGSSADRVKWLRRGLETGNPDACTA